MSAAAPWTALFLLGAWHGLNPGMGWLFAVALGMQERSTRAVVRSLAPISLGHAFSIAVIVLAANMIQSWFPLNYVRIGVAIALVALGIWLIARNRHFKWGGMRVSFGELTLWSFLMASAHGAGLMVSPITLSLAAGSHVHAGMNRGLVATAIHTLGYLTVTAAIAIVVYRKVGLAILRTAWFNLDFIWAVALIITGCLALIL